MESPGFTPTDRQRWGVLARINTSSALSQIVQIGTITPLLSLSMERQGVEPARIGLVVSASWLAIMVLYRLVPRLLVLFGLARASIISAALTVVAVLGMSLTREPMLLFMLNFVLGILTDYLIAADTRFKAAISGAGSGNRIAQYGHDQWLSFWRAEFPDPWLAPQAWIDASWPFFHAGQIRTPTLFMGGDRDWSVPLVGSEQMYQALKVNRVPTQLVIYPGEGHVLRRPSFVRDRLHRTIDWYAQWLR